MNVAVKMATENACTDGASTKATPRGALAALSLALLLSSLATSIANVALPTLAQIFGSPFQHVQWVVLAYLLAITTLIVGVGRLGDIIGRRRLLLAGLAVFTAASVLCGLASTLTWLIAARVAQGLGAAILMSLSLSLVAERVPAHRLGRAMGLLGTMSAVGTALGPTLGGVLIATLGWRAIFLVNLPLGLLAIALVIRTLPADRSMPVTDRARFDYPGMLLLMPTLAAYALAMTLGRGQFGALNAGLLLVAAVGAFAFVRVEARAISPLVHLSLFRHPLFGAGFAMSALVMTVMMATLVVGPFYLAGALALDAAHIGLAMSAGPVVAVLTGVPAGRLVDRNGPDRITQVGLIGMAIGCAGLACLPLSVGVAGYVAALVVTTAGYALFQAANTTAVMTGVSAEQRGVVSGLLNLSRNLGLITGAAAMGAIFALTTGTIEITSAGPAIVSRGLHLSFATATALIIAALAIAMASRRRAISAAFAAGR